MQKLLTKLFDPGSWTAISAFLLALGQLFPHATQLHDAAHSIGAAAASGNTSGAIYAALMAVVGLVLHQVRAHKSPDDLND